MDNKYKVVGRNNETGRIDTVAGNQEYAHNTARAMVASRHFKSAVVLAFDSRNSEYLLDKVYK